MASDRISDARNSDGCSEPSRVFISYSHDSEKHLERVLDLANRLRSDGVDAWIDQYEMAPSKGWPLWMEAQIEEAEFVICICTRNYRRKFQDREGKSGGLGVTWEGALAMTHLYLDRPSKAKFVPVVFDGGHSSSIPTSLAKLSSFDLSTSGGYEALYRLLTNQPRVVVPPLGKLQVLDSYPQRSRFGESIEVEAPLKVQDDSDYSSEKPIRPNFRDVHSERLGLELADALGQRDSLIESELETTAIDQRILKLKRELRKGPQLQPGEFLADDRYQLVKILGHGGFATVWLAQDRRNHLQVAVKVLHGQFSTSGERRERLFRGARQMAKLRHLHIVRVLESPQSEDGWAFFVMERLRGGDFRRAVLDRRLDLATRSRILLKVGQALDYAHRNRVIHRDVKPANILLDVENNPKLTDFDLVRADDTTGLTRTRAMMGSYVYAAPECMDDASRVTPSCDIYSLAAAAVFAIQEKELSPQFLMDREKYLSDLDLPAQSQKVLMEGLSLDPTVRPKNAVDFCHRLVEPFLGVQSRDLVRPKATVRKLRLVSSQTRTQVEVDSVPSQSQTKLFRVVSTLDGPVDFWQKIPAGTARVGSPTGEAGRDPDEGPAHMVRVLTPFWLAAVPITNAQFAAFDPARANLKRPQHPVIRVSWNQAMAFCRWLAETHGFLGARLPTELEWEYACRARSKTRFWSGDSEGALSRVGWYIKNAGRRTHSVGMKPANPWGLYDLHGNVWEWTASLWNGGYGKHGGILAVDSTKQVESLGHVSVVSQRVYRGGSCINSSRTARSAYRNSRAPSMVGKVLGFRVLLPFDPGA